MFLVEMSAEFPLELDPALRGDIMRQEKAYGQELQGKGKILHLWRVVGPKMANICVYNVSSPAELQEILAGLPMRPYLAISITPLAPHPSSLAVA